MSKSITNILNIISTEDVSKEYEINMKRFYPDYVLDKPRVKVCLIGSRLGVKETKIEIWTNEEYFKYIGQGYY